MSFSRLFGIFLTILFVGLLQNTDILVVAGVKPNLLLAALVVASFFVADWVTYIFLVLVAVILLQFQTSFDLELVVFSVLVIGLTWLNRFLQWTPHFTNVLLISLGTILFYAMVSVGFLLDSPVMVFLEIVYNSIIGLILYRILASESEGKKKVFQT